MRRRVGGTRMVGPWAAVLILVVASAIAAGYLHAGFQALSRERTWTPADAVVTARLGGGCADGGHCETYRLAYLAAGTAVTTTAPFGEDDDLQPGDPVAIRYNPARPAQLERAGFYSSPVEDLVLGTLAAAVVAVGLGSFLWRRARRSGRSAVPGG